MLRCAFAGHHCATDVAGFNLRALNWASLCGRLRNKIVQRRSLSSHQIPSPIKPIPHKDYSLYGRYSSALFNVARNKHVLEDVWADMNSLRSCLKESDDFKIFLETPGITVQEKAEAIRIIGKEFRFTELSISFLSLLHENHRLPNLKKAIDIFENFYRSARGEIQCTVSSADELTNSQKETVRKALEQRSPDTRLMMSYNISPSILGGLVVRLGNRTFDYSVATRVEQLKAQLLAPLPTI